MRYFQYLALILGVLLFAFHQSFAGEPQYFNLYGEDAVCISSYKIDDIARVTFSEDNMLIYFKNSTSPISTKFHELQYILFDEQSSVEDVVVDNADSSISIAYNYNARELSVVSTLGNIDSIVIVDLTGRTVYNFAPLSDNVIIDLSARYTNGVYVVYAQSSGKSATKKIII